MLALELGAIDRGRKILGHFASLDGLDAHGLQSVGKLG